MKKKKKISDFYFDDCEICQAQKRADEQGRNITLKKLEEAFRKAKGFLIKSLPEELP